MFCGKWDCGCGFRLDLVVLLDIKVCKGWFFGELFCVLCIYEFCRDDKLGDGVMFSYCLGKCFRSEYILGF